MYHGVFPRETIGNQWPYLTLSHYLLTGNIFKASEHMDEFRKYYARLGVLLVLERTVAKICERNFLKLIISLMNNTTRLNLKMVESILKNLGKKFIIFIIYFCLIYISLLIFSRI